MSFRISLVYFTGMMASSVPFGENKVAKQHSVGQGPYDTVPSLGAKIILACFVYPVSAPYYYRK